MSVIIHRSGLSSPERESNRPLCLRAENRTDQVGRVARITGQQHRALDAVDATRSPESIADDKVGQVNYT